MAVMRADDPADGLHRVRKALDLYLSGDPEFVRLDDATRRDFEGLGFGTFGRHVLLVGQNMNWRVPDRAFEGFELGLVFFASENWGGTNELRIYERGEQVAVWEEEGQQGTDHPLLRDLPDELHPFDRIQRVAERVLGVPPVELVDHPLFLIHTFG